MQLSNCNYAIDHSRPLHPLDSPASQRQIVAACGTVISPIKPPSLIDWTEMAEPRAKRTHARRSCELCKVRKTRCELPDLEVPSSSSPLPSEKACHRCRVLALPCVVDDSSKKARKRALPEDGSPARSVGVGGASAGAGTDAVGADVGRSEKAGTSKKEKGSSPKRKSKPRSSDVSRNGNINHSLDVMHGIQPGLEWDEQFPSWGQHDTSRDPFALSGASTAGFESRVSESSQVKSIKLHGRPLELVCAMLKVAYAKCTIKGGRKAAEEIDLDSLVDADMRRRLERG